MTGEKVRIERTGVGPKAQWRIVEVVGIDSKGTEQSFDWGYRFETQAAAVDAARKQLETDPEYYADVLETIRERFGVGADHELKAQE
jgi:hypothetical protein